MTRDEAIEIQYLAGLGKHSGNVYHRNEVVALLNLNYPQHVPQMARVRPARVRPPAGKAYWVKLEELEGDRND